MIAEEQTEEDLIIENLILEGGVSYEDADFMPIRQSLYEIESIAPQYDEELCSFITWSRPHDIYTQPEYFMEAGSPICVIQGSLPDDVFMGVLMAVAVYPGNDLVENIFASRPQDFKSHGVFTCRFYVEGEWVEVVTDTKIPSIRDQITGNYLPVYSRSANENEVWIPFIEKAYAKAVGNYESIQKAKIHEALLQLTGGSVQQVYLTNEQGEDLRDAWGVMFTHMQNDTIILAIPTEISHEIDPLDHDTHEEKDEKSVESQKQQQQSTASEEEEEDMAGMEDEELQQQNKGLQPNKLYSVVACKEVANFQLVLLHNPWSEAPCWKGAWSDWANDWDTYPEVLAEVESDPSIKWKRNKPNGYFWMSFKSFNKRFNSMYFCKIFPNSKFSYYCMRGEWKGSEAGGTVSTVRDREAVIKDSNESRFKALHRSVAADIIDGDCSWFNNPQFRVRTTAPTTLYISIVPLRGAELEKDTSIDMNTAPVACISVVSYSKSTLNAHLWDASACDICNTEFVNGTGRVKGQETSIWKQQISPNHNYQIVPTTLRRGILGSFILRVFSRHPVVVESVDHLNTSLLVGAWTKDSAGGPIKIVRGSDRPKENARWCQNPQYHFSLNNLFGKEELHVKIVVRRTDINPALKANAPTNSNDDPNVGLVICKAEYFYDAEELAIRNKGKSSLKGKPRENAMGEPIESRSSTLKKKINQSILDAEQMTHKPAAEEVHKKHRVLRKTNLLCAGPLKDEEYRLESTFSSKKEACIYFPKLPRASIPTGLVIVPCLSQPSSRGKFEVEVFCSEKFEFRAIPDAQSKVIAGSWAEDTAGGSHLHSTWKKNPKYSLRLKGTSKTVLSPGSDENFYSVRISLCRHGTGWRNKERKDTVGCMISFYIFSARNGDLTELYSAPFSPIHEVCTDDDFKLQPLKKGEEYVIMPTTNSPEIQGNFILSVMSEQEYIFTTYKEKAPVASKLRTSNKSNSIASIASTG